MIKLENFEVVGWEHAIRGMRNPHNSWDKSDSDYSLYLARKCEECGKWDLPEEDSCDGCWINDYEPNHSGFTVGPNDHKLMKKLAKGGSVHAKYRRMITVYVDITAPLYWWKEFDTYKVGTVANSCSTMHKIHEKEFTLEDFSTDHLIDGSGPYFIRNRDPLGRLKETIEELNFWRLCFVDENTALEGSILTHPDGSYMEKEDYWWQMIQLLPSSYNQKRTVMLNYEVLANIYRWRKDHKLDEWREFCEWIESLPYSEIITGETVNDVQSMKLSEAIDVIFPHNDRVAIWAPCKNKHYSMLVWSGMVHELPKKFLDSKNWTIRGFMAEYIHDSDRINIEVYDVGVDESLNEMEVK